MKQGTEIRGPLQAGSQDNIQLFFGFCQDTVRDSWLNNADISYLPQVHIVQIRASLNFEPIQY